MQKKISLRNKRFQTFRLPKLDNVKAIYKSVKYEP